MASANFLYTEKICFWTGGKRGAVKQTHGQQIQDLHSSSAQVPPTIHSEKPAPKNAAEWFQSQGCSHGVTALGLREREVI